MKHLVFYLQLIFQMWHYDGLKQSRGCLNFYFNHICQVIEEKLVTQFFKILIDHLFYSFALLEEVIIMEIKDVQIYFTHLNMLNLMELNFKIITYCLHIHPSELYFFQLFRDLFQLLNLIQIHEKHLQFLFIQVNFSELLFVLNQFLLNLCYYRYQSQKPKYYFKILHPYLPFKNQICFHESLQDSLQIYCDHHRFRVRSYKDETPSYFKSMFLSYQKIQF